MLVALIVLAVSAVAAVAVALSDRTIAGLAERKASQVLAGPFGAPPEVRVHATPFLTQALRGCYRDVTVAGGGLRVGAICGATLTARLTNIRLPPRELLGGRTGVLACEHVEGRLVLPYAELARISGVPGLSLRYLRGRLIATTALPVPGLSQLARVDGHASLRLDGTTVWVRVSELSVAGIGLTSLVLRQLLPQLSWTIPLRRLPWGLVVQDLRPEDAGLVVHTAAADVVFRAAAAAPRSDAV